MLTPEWIIGKYRDIADLSDRDTDKLRSLESLSKIAGLFDTDTKQEQLTVFQGFTHNWRLYKVAKKRMSLLTQMKKTNKDLCPVCDEFVF